MRAINGCHSKGLGQYAPYRMVFGEEYDDPIMSTMTSTASLHNNFAEMPLVENIVQYMDNTTKLRMNMLGEIGSINP